MLSKRTWIGVSLLGFVGALAWAVENQFFNTFVYDTITPDPRPISWMVAASAITATLTSILMGALSDRTRTRWGRRRPFILLGYLLWGVATAAFPSAALFHPIGLAVGMAILFDCVMTFFGSTANDAALNAYVADVTTPANRGRLVSLLYIASAVANLIIYAGAGMIIERWGYFPLFYLIGGSVILIGLFGGLLIQEPVLPPSPAGSYWGQIADTFRWESLRRHRDFFLLLLAMGLWGVAQQIFFPYLLIYLNHYLNFPPSTATLLVFIAILFGSILSAYPLGLLTDRWGRKRMAGLAILAEIIGLSAFSLARSEVTLTLTGILWLGAGTAWGIATNAWSKDLFPEEKRGQFAGYVILFTVAFTMIPGPLVGGWLATHYGIPTVLNGKPGFIPTPLIFQAAAAATILAALPLLGVHAQPRPSDPSEG